MKVQTETTAPRHSADLQQNWNDDPLFRSFLRRAAEMMQQQLVKNISSRAFDDYTVSWENEISDVSCAHVLIPMLQTDFVSQQNPNPETCDLACTGTSWNSNGHIIAASYGKIDVDGWLFEKGFLCAWNLMRRDLNPRNPDVKIEVESYLMCIGFHPELPNIIAGGLYNGKVQLWNFSPEERQDNLIGSSGARIDSIIHRDPVTALKWVQNKRDGSFLIVSTSGDGKVLIWSENNCLTSPVQAYSLMDNKITWGATSICFSAASEIASSSLATERLPTGRVSASIESPLVVSSESGRLFKCVLSAPLAVALKNQEPITKKTRLQNPIRFSFEEHFGYIHSVDFSPFHRNAFLSCSSDGSIAIYNLLQKKPVLRLFITANCLYGACWSLHRPLVIAAISNTGMLYFFDLGQSRVNPVVQIDTTEATKCALVSISFNQNPLFREYVATGDERGAVRIWRLNHVLSSSSGHAEREQRILEDIVSGSN